jgi:hypothetical protein
LDIRISCLTDRRDAAVFDANVSFQNSAVIDDYRIGDHSVDGIFGSPLRLAHPVSDDFAAPKLHFFSVDRTIALDLDKELRVG